MRIINHDGGHKVLKEFAKFNALCQLNLTLGRQLTVKEVLTAMDGIDKDKKKHFARRASRTASGPRPTPPPGR